MADSSDDPNLDILPEYYDGNMIDYGLAETVVFAAEGSMSENRPPLWPLRFELNSGERQKITFYNQNLAPEAVY